MEQPASGDDPGAAMHHAFVDTLKDEGKLLHPNIEAAFRAIPRHLFLPGVVLEEVYRDWIVVVKEHDGRLLSTSSQPSAMAGMLFGLDLQPGQRVLEIGAGTGYNAALMAHMVGDTGQVITIDIDADLVAQARANLHRAGYGRVQVICADGGLGYPDVAPYDRIILTVGADDLAPAWCEQLAQGGRLLIPLGVTPFDAATGRKLMVIFERTDDYLQSIGMGLLGMVPLRGAFAVAPEGIVPLGPEPGVNLIGTRSMDADRLYDALTGQHKELPTAVRCTVPEIDVLRLWLASRDPCFCDLYAEGETTKRSIVPSLLQMPFPPARVHTFGLAEAATLCVLNYPADQISAPKHFFDRTALYDLVVRCYGPDLALAQRLVEQIDAWQTAGKPLARLRAYPLDAVYTPAPHEAVINLRSARLIFAWQ
jgi:protein-L-isoaspartate(D-aspartate) O-methyltransferase